MILQSEFVVITCSNCGIQFAMSQGYDNHLRDTHATFYCPNGHKQWYPGESEAAKFQRLYNAEAAKLVPLREKLVAEERAHKRTKKKLKSVETRAAAGVCPCCNRTFHQLAEHMESKHPEYKVLQGLGTQKQLTGEISKEVE